MKKSTLAAIAAASVMGFGLAGNALAAEVSGFLDVRYNAMEDMDSQFATSLGTGEEGTFTLNGEIDVVHEADGATVRFDLNILNLLNPNGPTEGDQIILPETVTVEQANAMLPVPGVDILTLTAGLWNSPFGLEGQDATDIEFATNGMLWHSVPHNMGGALLTAKPTDQLAINLGYINSRTDTSGGLLADRSNDMVLTANFNVNENIGIGVGYLTDNSTVVSVDGSWGNQINAYVTANDLVPGLGLSFEYLDGDAADNQGMLDNGMALNVSYDVLENLGVALRYEQASYENGIGNPTDDWNMGSVAVNYHSSDNCVVRLDYTEAKNDMTGGVSSQDMTIQMVHSF
ncbi:MAG: porin [Nitrospirota bacterium]|nr:porin [Nitrospirota bacterium]